MFGIVEHVCCTRKSNFNSFSFHFLFRFSFSSKFNLLFLLFVLRCSLDLPRQGIELRISWIYFVLGESTPSNLTEPPAHSSQIETKVSIITI